MTDLHGRYERLLFAYPRDYRRHRGAEIAGTYTEMAAEGQRWPRGRDAVSLVLHGLRARLGRPRGRLVVPLTLLAMLIGGLCAAAGGARAGWGGSTGLSSGQLAAINRLGPTPSFGRTPNIVSTRAGTPAWFTGYLSMPAWDAPATYTMTGMDASTDQPMPAPPRPSVRELVDRERARLAAGGWRITGQHVTDDGATMMVRDGGLVARLDASDGTGSYVYLLDDSPSSQPGRTDLGQTYWTYTYTEGTGPDQPGSIRFYRPTVVLRAIDDGSSGFGATVYRTTPANVPAFMAGAGLLGAALTYLLIGWVNRRAGRLATWRRRAVTAGLALTTALAASAAAVCGAGLWTALRHHGDMPIRYWGGFVAGDVRIAALAAAVLLVATVAGAALLRPTPPPAEVAAQ